MAAVVALAAIPVLAAAADDTDDNDRDHHHDDRRPTTTPPPRRRHHHDVDDPDHVDDHDHVHDDHHHDHAADHHEHTVAGDAPRPPTPHTTTTPPPLAARPPWPCPLRRPTSAPAGQATPSALAWNAVPGAETYKVYIATSGAGPFTVAGTWPSARVHRRQPRRRHPLLRSCLRQQRRGLVANEHHPCRGTDVLRPAAPANLRARRSDTTISLAWNAVPGAETYKVYVATSGAGPFTVAGTWPSAAFTIGNLDAGTRYYVRVSASNAAGWSPTSTTLVVPLRPPAAPVNLRARRWRTTSRWRGTPRPGASKYVIFVATSPPARTRS